MPHHKVATILNRLLFIGLLLISASSFADSRIDIKGTYDFIVVGAGTSGCAVAGRLSENGKYSVLLLERGLEPPDSVLIPALGSTVTARANLARIYQTVPQQNAGLNQNGTIQFITGSCLGGTSAINGMHFNRGSPYDYDNWARITGDASWKYSNLLRLFKKMESYRGLFPSEQHGYSGPIAVSRARYAPGMNDTLEAGRFLGFRVLDANGPQQTSFAPLEFSQRSGRRVTSYEAYIRPFLETRKNLEVVPNAEVSKIIMEGNRAVGVTYISSSGTNVSLRARKEVIISAGVVNSPVVLMKSGIGPRNLLETSGIPIVKELPVGENTHDHVLLVLRFVLRNSSQVYLPARDLTLDNFLYYQKSGDGPYSQFGGDTQAFLSSSKVPRIYRKLGWADLHFIFVHHVGGIPVPGLPEISPDDISEGEVDVVGAVILTRPKSRGSIKLNTTNPTADPLIDFRYLTEPQDVDTMLEGIKLVIKVFENTPQFQRHGAHLPATPHPACAGLSFRSDEYWRCYIHAVSVSSLHAAGSNSMNAVVDSRLRVIGIQNLRVADCSIMPEVTNANTQAAAYVIAEKVSEDILRTWEKPV